MKLRGRAGRTRRPRPLERVAIIGAGTMGGGIAMACANAGLQVVHRRRYAGGARQRSGHDSTQLRIVGQARAP